MELGCFTLKLKISLSSGMMLRNLELYLCIVGGRYDNYICRHMTKCHISRYKLTFWLRPAIEC